ncbi:unnamed protein product, partial [Meganyctiphanes norvegica]
MNNKGELGTVQTCVIVDSETRGVKTQECNNTLTPSDNIYINPGTQTVEASGDVITDTCRVNPKNVYKSSVATEANISNNKTPEVSNNISKANTHQDNLAEPEISEMCAFNSQDKNVPENSNTVEQAEKYEDTNQVVDQRLITFVNKNSHCSIFDGVQYHIANSEIKNDDGNNQKEDKVKQDNIHREPSTNAGIKSDYIGKECVIGSNAVDLEAPGTSSNYASNNEVCIDVVPSVSYQHEGQNINESVCRENGSDTDSNAKLFDNDIEDFKDKDYQPKYILENDCSLLVNKLENNRSTPLCWTPISLLK